MKLKTLPWLYLDNEIYPPDDRLVEIIFMSGTRCRMARARSIKCQGERLWQCNAFLPVEEMMDFGYHITVLAWREVPFKQF